MSKDKDIANEIAKIFSRKLEDKQMKCGDIVCFKSGKTVEEGRIVGYTDRIDGIVDYTIYQEAPETDSGYRIYRDIEKEDIISIVEKRKEII